MRIPGLFFPKTIIVRLSGIIFQIKTSIIGGILTYKAELIGFKILIGCYIVQVCALSVGVFSFMISTGPVLFVKYDFSEAKLATEVGLFQVAYHLDFSGQYDYFSINLIAVTIILILIKESKRIRRKESK